jgi:hypothetical protein
LVVDDAPRALGAVRSFARNASDLGVADGAASGLTTTLHEDDVHGVQRLMLAAIVAARDELLVEQRIV